MEEKYNYDIIRNYLLGLCDHDTALKVSTWIRTDEITRSIAEGILRLEKKFDGNEEAMENYLSDFEKRQLNIVDSNLKQNRAPGWVGYKMAASILIFISIGLTTFFILDMKSSDSIIESELRETYPLSNRPRAGETTSNKEKAFQYYAEGKFELASTFFSRASDSGESDRASIHFYNGMCFLYLHKFESANRLLSSTDVLESRYHQQARWFSALTLIQLKREEEARAELTKIVADRSYKYERAQELLTAID